METQKLESQPLPLSDAAIAGNLALKAEAQPQLNLAPGGDKVIDIANGVTAANEPSAKSDISHANPDTSGKTAAEYTYEALKLHQDQYKDQGKPPSPLLKWIGDASLATLPKNRMYNAIGLTTGLLVAGNMANIATGHTISGEAVKKVPTYLKWLQGVVKNYDPKGLDLRNRSIKYAQMGVYSLGGLIGIKTGTDLAYVDTVRKNKDPQYLEDYLTNVSHTQGKNWSWLSATAGIWGSASGIWAVPIPGINYATGMIGRITSMQDRNTMVKGLNEITSGATTTSYLRLKEGVNYLSHYAVGNPAKDPAQIEYLAYTLLGPLFKDKLTADHIKQFTDAVHEVRDHYWQEGGIPKEKRKEATQTMKEVFTGAGLEVLLIDMGLNPATIAFDDVNGLIGKIGDIGQKKEIHAKQEAFWKAMEERMVKYVDAGIISQERADWVKEGIADMKAGRKQQAPAPALESNANSPIEEKAKAVAEIIGKKSRQSSIDNLIHSATRDSEDWRQTVLKQRQDTATQPFIGD